MKKLMLYKLIIIIGLLFNGSRVFATAQTPDLLVEGKDTFAVFSNPLEQYLDLKRSRTFCGEKLEWTSTGCYRGYQALWTIHNDSLFLVRVYLDCDHSKNSYFDLKKEFNSAGLIFAKWYTGQIMSPRGSLLQYIHDGYASIFENERFYTFTKGKVDSLRDENYVVLNKSCLYPSVYFLKDTLYEIILTNLNLSLFQNVLEVEDCGLTIRFNSNGLIDSIYNEYTYDGESITEKYILSVAKQSLRNLPRLMEVLHKDYRPPKISLFFCGHCLIYPWDTQYGCPKSDKYSQAPVQDQKVTFLNKNAARIFTIIGIIFGCGLIFIFIYKKFKT